ncbi:hypothetical protein BJV82DRAFT_666511 [Fennellomyces sp. T-0311]|nr:hypothetical protein BJV82DRAFT_666511 [Fennellomyces sp. T-0311]
MALRVATPPTIDEITKHLHHRSLPPSPPQPLPSSNRQAHRLSLPPPIISPPLPSPSNSHRLSWNKPPLSEIPEEEDVSLKHMQSTTQYILEEIKKLAHEVIEADARAETYRKQYMETLDKFESLQSQHTAMLQQLHHQQQEQQHRSKPKHRKM